MKFRLKSYSGKRSGLKIFSILGFVIVLLFSFSRSTPAQGCLPGKGALYYIVRDKKGKTIDPTKLVVAPFRVENVNLDKTVKDKTEKVIAYGDYHSAGCGLREDKVELKITIGGKTMNLRFNNLKNYLRVTVDSIPFQAGDFEINTRGERDESGIVQAKGWKKLTKN
jgi:hypothetical protein